MKRTRKIGWQKYEDLLEAHINSPLMDLMFKVNRPEPASQKKKKKKAKISPTKTSIEDEDKDRFHFNQPK